MSILLQDLMMLVQKDRSMYWAAKLLQSWISFVDGSPYIYLWSPLLAYCAGSRPTTLYCLEKNIKSHFLGSQTLFQLNYDSKDVLTGLARFVHHFQVIFVDTRCLEQCCREPKKDRSREEVPWQIQCHWTLQWIIQRNRAVWFCIPFREILKLKKKTSKHFKNEKLICSNKLIDVEVWEDACITLRFVISVSDSAPVPCYYNVSTWYGRKQQHLLNAGTIQHSEMYQFGTNTVHLVWYSNDRYGKPYKVLFNLAKQSWDNLEKENSKVLEIDKILQHTTTCKKLESFRACLELLMFVLLFLKKN